MDKIKDICFISFNTMYHSYLRHIVEVYGFYIDFKLSFFFLLVLLSLCRSDTRSLSDSPLCGHVLTWNNAWQDNIMPMWQLF